MLRRPCSVHSRSAAAHRQHVESRKITHVYAQQLATVHSTTSVREDDGKGKPGLPVQLSRPTLPCDKPLPLANVMEVQRLLFLLEAPEYCMRAFREHGVNGQDLLHMQGVDLEDSRFKFPRPVQRKVLRIAHAWRTFHSMTGLPTSGSLSLERFLDHHRGGSPEALSQLQSAFQALDVNNNGAICFEEFLVGYALLQAAGAHTADPATPAIPAAVDSSPVASSGTGPHASSGGAASSSPAAIPPTPAASPAVLSACIVAGGSSLASSFTSWFRL